MARKIDKKARLTSEHSGELYEWLRSLWGKIADIYTATNLVSFILLYHLYARFARLDFRSFIQRFCFISLVYLRWCVERWLKTDRYIA